MKKNGILLLAFAMIMCLFSPSAKASAAENFNADLTAYLSQVSNERGMEVTKDDLEYALGLYSESLADFDSVDGLKDFLGEVIKADCSNLTSLYEKYNLNQESLTDLLKENGETLKDYVFLNGLDATLAFYQEDGNTNQETGFEEKLTAYLNEISGIRGFTVSRQMAEAYLSKYQVTFSRFETVQDLKDFLGDVIKSDLSNLDYFNKEYQLSKEDINARLSTAGKSLEDYVFIDDLELDILNSDDGKISYRYFMSMMEEAYPGITDKLGLTEAEYTKAYQYFMSLKDYYTSEETQNKMLDLMTRFEAAISSMMDSKEKLTLDQLTTLQGFYQELQDLLKIKITYSVTENGKKVPLTLSDMLDGRNLEDAVINIDFYTESSEFLMDIQLSAAMFGTVIDEMGNTPLPKPGSSVNNTVSKPVKTVTGGKLPKTASHNTAGLLAGASFTLIGAILYKSKKKNKEETDAA